MSDRPWRAMRVALAGLAVAVVAVACVENLAPSSTTLQDFEAGPAAGFARAERFRQVGSEHSRILRLLREDFVRETGERGRFASADARCRWWKGRGHAIIVAELRRGPFRNEGTAADRQRAEADLARFGDQIGVCGATAQLRLAPVTARTTEIHPDSFQWFPSQALVDAHTQALTELGASANPADFSARIAPLYHTPVPNWLDASILVGSLAAGEDSYAYWEANPPTTTNTGTPGTGGGGTDPIEPMMLTASAATPRSVARADLGGCVEAVFMTWWGRVVSKSGAGAGWMCLGGAVYRSAEAVF